jgi:hypothetical protein
MLCSPLLRGDEMQRNHNRPISTPISAALSACLERFRCNIIYCSPQPERLPEIERGELLSWHFRVTKSESACIRVEL